MNITWNTLIEDCREAINQDEKVQELIIKMYNRYTDERNLYGGCIQLIIEIITKSVKGENRKNNKKFFLKDIYGYKDTNQISTFDRNISKLNIQNDIIQKLYAIPDDNTLLNLKDMLYNEIYIKQGKSDIFNQINNFLQVLVGERLVDDIILKNKFEGSKKEMNLYEQLKNLIDNGTKQIIITGPPGTGKTRVALKLAKEYMNNCDKNNGREILENEEIYFVQFHPSYDYTDFVEGLRPFEVGEGNETKMVFRKVDGIFKSFCRKVVKLNKGENEEEQEQEERIKNNKYFFIIDEINRADLSKVLGELMFSLEGDKRGPKNKVQTQYNNIGNCYDRDNKLITDKHDNKLTEITGEEDCFKEGFYIPENVIIIGTMNDIDRSVESMDFALRRRFTWVNAKVDRYMLLDAFDAKIKNDNGEYELDEDGNPKYAFFNHIKEDREIINDKYKNEVINKVIDSIGQLNSYIKDKDNKYSLNENYCISQGYFKDIPTDKTSDSEILDYVWKYRLESLLYEYVRGEKEDNIKTFISNCETIFNKNEVVNTNSNPENNTENPSSKDDKASSTSETGE